MTLVIILGVGQLLGAGAAKTGIPKSLEQLFDAADVVTVATVTDYQSEYVKGNRCAVRYSAHVVEQFKPSDTISRVEFGRFDGLAVGRTYLLFLKHVANPSDALKEFDQGSLQDVPKESLVDLLRCNGVVPGLSYEQDAAWEIKNGAVTIVGLLPQSLPMKIGVDEGATAEWLLNGSDVFGYLKELQRSEAKRD